MQSQRRLVLVVDADQGFAEDARMLFSGQRVLTARSIDEAAEIVPGGRIDVAVLGPSLGSEEGIVAARDLRTVDPTLPLVLVANLVTNRMMLAGMKTGLAGVVETPLTPGKVDEILAAARGGHPGPAAVGEPDDGPVVSVEIEAVAGSAVPAAFTAPTAPALPAPAHPGDDRLFAPDPEWEEARPVGRTDAREVPDDAPTVVASPPIEVVAGAGRVTPPGPIVETPPPARVPPIAAEAESPRSVDVVQPLPPAFAPQADAPVFDAAPALPAWSPPPTDDPVVNVVQPLPPAFAPQADAPVFDAAPALPSWSPPPTVDPVFEYPPPPPAPPPTMRREADELVVVHPEDESPLRSGVPAASPFAHPEPTPSPALRPAAGGGRVVAVMAGKGGSGKTVTATNLAMALTFQRGDGRVVIVDTDLQFGDVALMLQLDPSRTLLDFVGKIDDLSDARFESMLLRHESGLRVLPAPVLPTSEDEVPAKLIAAIIDRLRALYEVVVIDTPPIFDDHLITVLEQADDVLVVVDMDLPSVKNAKIALDALRGAGFPMGRIQLVVNRVNAKARLDLVELERSLGLRVAGSIPSDRLVPQSVNEGIPVVALSPRSRVARAFHVLAGLVRTGDTDR